MDEGGNMNDDTKDLYKEMRYKALEGLLGEAKPIAEDGILRFSYDVVPEEILKDSKFFVCAFMIKVMDFDSKSKSINIPDKLVKYTIKNTTTGEYGTVGADREGIRYYFKIKTMNIAKGKDAGEIKEASSYFVLPYDKLGIYVDL